MDIEKIKEEISISYISALCAYAGIDYDRVIHDEDSTDGQLKKIITLNNGRLFQSQLRVQLKCTSSLSQYSDKGDCIIYKLKVKNYNDLCTPATTPIILCLLILPEDQNEWLKWSEEELIIKGRMYWKCFFGENKTDNASTINVKIDKSNVINSISLQKLLERVAEEVLLL